MRYTASILTLVAPVFMAWPAAGQQVGTCETPLAEAYLDINNVRARIFNNGNLFWRGAPHVYEVPKGGGASAIFNAGLWVGGRVDSELRVAAARYSRYQFWAGPLDDNGDPPADCSIYDRMYKVSRSDIDAYEATGKAPADLREWPTGLGAPTYAAPNNGLDDDGDGDTDEDGGEVITILDQPLASRESRIIDLAGGERPAILGDQSIWWVMNDRGNEHRNANGVDSPPIGLEVHAMASAFNHSEPFRDVTFFKYDLLYKGDNPLAEAYVAMYADPDLGFWGDDWIGSDTTREMGFVWNSDNVDEGGEGYGTPPPALGIDFLQGPIVASVGDTARVRGAPIPDFKNLGMTYFGYYKNSGAFNGEPQNAKEYYNYMRGLWRDGVRWAHCDWGCYPFDAFYPGDVGESDEECQWWSECNSDDFGHGHDSTPGDRRFFMSAGPFTMAPSDSFQQVVFGVVWARGENNFNSVTALKRADDAVQTAFDVDFRSAPPPDGPEVTATPADQSVILEWTNRPQSNNLLESYVADDPFTQADDNDYLFEGYDVIQYEDVSDEVGHVIATFDIPNGVTRVVDGLPGEPSAITATGADIGVTNSYTVTGLTNYKTYHFAVQAYAYNAPSFPKVYRGPRTRISVVPTKPTVDVSDAARALMGGEDPDFTADGIVAQGDGEVYARVTNPITMVDATYAVDFYSHTFAKQGAGAVVAPEDDIVDPQPPEATAKAANTGATATTYDISRDGHILFNGREVPFAAPQRPRVFAADGLLFDVLGPSAGFKDFFVTANASGRLDPPDYAAWGWAGMPDPRGLVVGTRGYQQVSGAVWGYHAGGGQQDRTYPEYGPATSSGSFLDRTMRGGALYPYLGSYDYEQRFTQECMDQMDGVIDVEKDCLAFRQYSDLAIMEMPFTLWRTGVDTWNDSSDDIQMIPIICDTDTCGGGDEHGVYDIGGDHGASGGDNDPYSDWVYWNLPNDTSPGSAGYQDFFEQLDGGTNSGYLQVIARTVLVAWNEGTSPPYDRPLPESGTVFMVQTNKQNQPGDKYAFSTAGYGATQPAGDRARERLKDIGIVPNPYKGASDYEVGQFTSEVRFTNMPDVATIRVFTLNGTLIKTIKKNSPGVATISWNLVTEYNLPIASGLYLIHISVPDVGETVLKFAVIKKRVQLNVY